ncbi:hypothetical protein JCM10914A_29690 [Paenibacillus sp. JCM 10914]
MIERLAHTNEIIIAAHRGWKSAYPENTLLAFRKALERGADMLELDLRLTRDQELVVIHDQTVDRTTDGTGNVGDYALTELKRLDAGGWFGPEFQGLEVPTFREFCDLLTAYPEVLLNVEIKPAANAIEAADLAIAMLRDDGYLERCVFTCFDANVLTHIHDTYYLPTQGFPGQLMSNYVAGPEGTMSKMWAVGISMKLLTPELVQNYRKQGILPWSYCPDEEEQVRYALECGTTTMTVNDLLPAMKVREEEERKI